MSTRMVARRTFVTTTAIGVDTVFTGMSLPKNTAVHRIKARVSVVDDAIIPVANARPYAVEGWVLPITDPDGGASLDTIFDQLVPKDTDATVLDLDTGATDTTPFYEPGEIDLSALIPIGVRPKRIFKRIRMLTAADGSLAVWQDTVTPFLAKWIAGEAFDIDIRKGFRVMQPSIVVFALASPAGDDTSASGPTHLAENEWGQIQYVDHVLQRAMLHLLGVTESGAETPWEEAIAVLSKHLDPDVYESVAGLLGAGSWTAHGNMLIDHSVDGEMGKQLVTTGR